MSRILSLQLHVPVTNELIMIFKAGFRLGGNTHASQSGAMLEILVFFTQFS